MAPRLPPAVTWAAFLARLRGGRPASVPWRPTKSIPRKPTFRPARQARPATTLPDSASLDAYPPAAFYFRVGFGAEQSGDAAFQEVGGIGPEMETESYQEGGENRFVHTLPKGVKHPKLTLKRGVAAFDSDLVVWCREVLEGGLGTRIKPRLVHVNLLDEKGEPLRGWTFENAYPAHWSVDAFQAEKNAVAIEKIELNYAASTRKL